MLFIKHGSNYLRLQQTGLNKWVPGQSWLLYRITGLFLGCQIKLVCKIRISFEDRNISYKAL